MKKYTVIGSMLVDFKIEMNAESKQDAISKLHPKTDIRPVFWVSEPDIDILQVEPDDEISTPTEELA